MKFALLIAGTLITSVVSAADLPAPTSIVIVACKVDDLTGAPGRQDPNMAAQGWRDLELTIINGEYQCKREQLDLEDGSLFGSHQPNEMIPLHPNFGDMGQCAHVAAMQAADYNEKHKGWAVVAVGCPTRIVNQDGTTVGWQMPSCPEYLPGTENRMRCNFSDSVI